MLKGDLTEGVSELVFGGSIAIPFAKIGFEEVRDYADSTAQLAVSELDSINSKKPKNKNSIAT